MSYIDETYGKQLEEALRGLVSRPALGQPWFGFHASEVPAGVLLFTATTHSRVLYADFWKYIQDKNLVKTEEEWQSIYSEQGWCPFYSDGDGIDTFRMPSAPLYLHGAGAGDAGKYVQAGLPNITAAYINNGLGDQAGYTGAFYSNETRSRSYAAHSATTVDVPLLSFDASRSSAIYGRSDTVTPETSKMLFGVWAISAPQQPIPDATIEGIISELGVASNNTLEANTKAETAINSLNGVVRSVNGVNADAAGNVALKAVITETWSSGTSWYRKWSDGWIEQGGTVQYSRGWKVQTFQAPFSNNQYTITTSTQSSTIDHSGNSFQTSFTLVKTANGANFKFAIYAGGTGCTLGWYACGY